MIFIEEIDERFYLDNSLIPNAGKGVFAKQLIRQGERLKIIGMLVKLKGISDQCTEYSKWHRFKVRGYHLVPMGYGGMVNHAPTKDLENVSMIYQEGELYYQALRFIYPNEEILHSFSDNYNNYLLSKEVDNEINVSTSEVSDSILGDFYDLDALISKDGTD